ncbi:hypothetical protein MA16_Dca024699 [Dendrobium catenatum]|uniref:Uncharacterized protein n=1 Tax=Dendrobium catenatum TaxID=906689 RepID=A0A2I0VG58_9ASPA|nr:hypothetical protein MA16_Dca024699 [Dendrobium catenatum]
MGFKQRLPFTVGIRMANRANALKELNQLGPILEVPRKRKKEMMEATSSVLVEDLGGLSRGKITKEEDLFGVKGPDDSAAPGKVEVILILHSLRIRRASGKQCPSWPHHSLTQFSFPLGVDMHVDNALSGTNLLLVKFSFSLGLDVLVWTMSFVAPFSFITVFLYFRLGFFISSGFDVLVIDNALRGTILV